MTSISLRRAILFSALGCGVPQPSAAQDYLLIDLGRHTPLSINEQGHVTGQSLDNLQNAFRRNSEGEYDYFGPSGSFGSATNQDGVIVGGTSLDVYQASVAVVS